MIRAPAEVGPFLTEYDRYLVVGHLEPDGDCVASAVAMARFLERRGKTVVLADQGPFDRPEVAGFQSLFRTDAPPAPETGRTAAVVVDCSTADRLGPALEAAVAGLSVLVIDHHASGQRFGTVRWVEPSAPAVTYMVQLLLESLGERIPAEDAELLLFGLCTDTGFFRHLGPGQESGEALQAVARLVEDTVLAFGGLDLLVSNAGVLRAGGLEETDLATFEFVNKVNYTAYYLGVRQASRPMKVQHRFDPGWFADIIQINSKSGLEGSNRNFAYAGSKFAGIGLTQSFALELVEHNIKVNAVCPGNLFDGPLWSDPQTGLFVQYLRTGKVPGATTIAEVRRHYEAKVPMRRGCTIRDVARAIFYLLEQEYETGQALPVTGGQVMLK